MKMFVINGKKVGTYIIIIGLMLVLIGFEQYFDNTLSKSSLIQSNLNPLKEYTEFDGKLKYKLPEEWTTNKKEFNSNEITYHNEFNSQELGILGFVQVWNKRGDLKEFLDRSKIISEKQNEISNYSINKIKINDFDGYLVKYVMKSQNDKMDYAAYEYFVDTDDNYIRFSFFIRGDKYKDNMKKIFDTIVNTIELL